MDEFLQKALEFSNYNQSLSIQKKVLTEKFESKITFGYGGGIFKIDRNLICFVKFLIDEGRTDNVVLLDSNDNPVMVSNLVDFKEQILDRYFSAVNEKYAEFEKIKKSRTIESLVDL